MPIIQMFLAAISAIAYIASWNQINHLPPWNGFYSEALAAVSLLAAFTFYLTKGQFFSIKKTSLLLMTALVLQILYQYHTKQIYFRSTWILYCYYFLFIAIAFQVGQFIKKDNHQQAVASVLLMTALASAILAFADWVGMGNQGIFVWLIDSQQLSFTALGNIMQPNHLGTLCSMGLGAIIIIWDQKGWCWLSALPAVLLLSAVAALTASRAAMVNMLVLLCLAWIFNAAKQRNKAMAIALTSLAVFALVTVYASPLYSALLLGDPAGRSIVERGASTAGRTALWAQAIDAIKLQPWTGFGWRQIPASQILVASKHPGIYATIYYHNFFIDFLVENGILFALIYALLLFYIFRKYRINKNKPFFMIAGMLIVPSMTEYQFAYTFLLLPAILCLSIALDYKLKEHNFKNKISKRNVVSYVVLTIFGLCSAAIFVDYIKCEQAFVSIRLKTNGIAPNGVKNEIPQVYVLDDLALLSTIYLLDKPVYTREDLTKLQYLSARFPYIVIKHFYIRALVQFGDVGRAKIIYKGVLGCYGKNAQKYLNDAIEANPALHAVKGI